MIAAFLVMLAIAELPASTSTSSVSAPACATESCSAEEWRAAYEAARRAALRWRSVALKRGEVIESQRGELAERAKRIDELEQKILTAPPAPATSPSWVPWAIAGSCAACSVGTGFLAGAIGGCP